MDGSSSQPQPILYYRNFCLFCWQVLNTIKALGIDVELRNIWEEESYQKELTTATGRTTVPVLRLLDEHGESTWMPESADIIRYLKTTYRA